MIVAAFVTVTYRANHIADSGYTEVHSEAVKGSAQIPRVGDYVCLGGGWAAMQITMSIYEPDTMHWIICFNLRKDEAIELQKILEIK